MRWKASWTRGRKARKAALRGGGNAICKVLYQTYKKPIPEHIVSANLKCLPSGVTHTLFDDDMLYKFFDNRPEAEKNLFHGLQNFAHKADLWRYIQVYETGGFYLDADAYLENGLDENQFDDVDAVYLYDPLQDNAHNGFFYSKKHSPILRNVIDSMLKIGTDIPKTGRDGTCREGADPDSEECCGYWYNLVLLRDELAKAIGQPLNTLKKPVDHKVIEVDGQRHRIMILTERNQECFMGPDGRPFYYLKHKEWPY